MSARGADRNNIWIIEDTKSKSNRYSSIRPPRRWDLLRVRSWEGCLVKTDAGITLR